MFYCKEQPENAFPGEKKKAADSRAGKTNIYERIENHSRRVGQVCHRRETETASAAEEYGSAGPEQTYGLVPRVALETGTRCDASHLAHAIADRYGFQRGPGLLLRSRTEAALGDRPQERSDAVPGF